MYNDAQITVPAMMPNVCTNPAEWFAIQTRSRHEKKAAAELEQRGITTFLPLVSRLHQWSDRRKRVELPLFSCYVFVQIVSTPESRLSVLRAQGVLSFVGRNSQGTPIPSNQIENLRTLIQNNVPMYPLPFIKIGQRVRIRGGSLNGVEGILVAAKGGRQLVVSVETIQRSVSLSIEGYDVEPA